MLYKLGELILYCYMVRVFKQQQRTLEINKQQMIVGNSFLSGTLYQIGYRRPWGVPRRVPIRKTGIGPYMLGTGGAPWHVPRHCKQEGIARRAVLREGRHWQ